MGLYRHDFRAWALEQADAALRRSANEIDWENVAEELRSLGGQVEWELYNRYEVLLMHLLKWKYQPKGRGRSWRATIVEQRRRIKRLVRKNPSLKSVEQDEFTEAYTGARTDAIEETDLTASVFPELNPFTVVEAKCDDFWPEAD